MRNGYSYLAELLSSNQRHSFHRQMAKFLTIQDNTIVILSLATLACMIPDDKNLSQTPEGRQKTGTIEFFHGKRATKVLGLVMSIVIDLASREAAEWRRCVELIDMATVIVGAVADALKAAWAEKEHINFQKLLEKASRPDLDRRVLTEVGMTLTTFCICLRGVDFGIRNDSERLFASDGTAGRNRKAVTKVVQRRGLPF